ncbi:hypothetical protein A6D6_00857 [Alcanivorax xiamenensis]|uniref:Uncharacterized protein n=1 Tax=Alcanivorax xiamenensis TaxID=1177156 RepID=A0ABQ6YB86_9GAMM|nr:hypothetical protein A6D6_00857 [Alcanivorax xiamenensis]
MIVRKALFVKNPFPLIFEFFMIQSIKESLNINCDYITWAVRGNIAEGFVRKMDVAFRDVEAPVSQNMILSLFFVQLFQAVAEDMSIVRVDM